MQSRLPRWVWAFVGVVSLLRLIVAARVPLTPDETYYWTWSLHPSFAYTDHPPMVAWLIAAASPFGDAPGVARSLFVLCEAGTAIALGEAAVALGGTGAAGAVAALAFTLIPQTKIALGEALPDAPYAFFWALSLLLTLRLARRPSTPAAVTLGVALGATVLSRFFGWALIAGVVAFALEGRQRELRRYVAVAVAIAIALYVPFLVGDALHGWQNLAFTVFRRQTLHGATIAFAVDSSAIRFSLYTAAFWIVAFFVAIRPRLTLIAWTALPLPLLFVVLSFFGSVEAYWLLGPYVSLCLGIGVAVARLPLSARRFVGAIAALPALATTAIVGFWALDEPTQSAILVALGPSAKGTLYSSVYMFPALATDVRAQMYSERVTPLSNRLEVLAELRYYGLRAAMIGDAPQKPQWNGWYDDAPAPPPEALIVTYSPLDGDPNLAAGVARAYARVGPSVPHVYAFAGTAAGTFYFTRCSGLRAGAGWP